MVLQLRPRKLRHLRTSSMGQSHSSTSADLARGAQKRRKRELRAVADAEKMAADEARKQAQRKKREDAFVGAAARDLLSHLKRAVREGRAAPHEFVSFTMDYRQVGRSVYENGVCTQDFAVWSAIVDAAETVLQEEGLRDGSWRWAAVNKRSCPFQGYLFRDCFAFVLLPCAEFEMCKQKAQASVSLKMWVQLEKFSKSRWS